MSNQEEPAMFGDRGDFDELGTKVARAHQALNQIHGIGVVNGIRVVVDAENHLLSVTVPDEDTILTAYRAAIRDIQSRVADATRELRADPRFDAVSTYVEANTARQLAEQHRHQQRRREADDRYFADRNRYGWLEPRSD